MEKDKKYNIILGLMIFFFILFVGVCIAWGLGIIGLKDNVVKENKELYITKNDYGTMVVMSLEKYQELIEKIK